MWCTSCRQDVPGLASTEGREYRCARCGTVVCEPAAASIGERIAPLDASADDGSANLRPPAPYDPWEVNEALRHVERVLEAGRRVAAPLDHDRRLRFDPTELSRRHVSAGVGVAQEQRPSIAKTLAWFCLACGVMALACGAALMTWSLAGHRPALWTLGLPVALAGQLTLVVGLLLYVASTMGERGARDPHGMAPRDGAGQRVGKQRG